MSGLGNVTIQTKTLKGQVTREGVKGSGCFIAISAALLLMNVSTCVVVSGFTFDLIFTRDICDIKRSFFFNEDYFDAIFSMFSMIFNRVFDFIHCVRHLTLDFTIFYRLNLAFYPDF